nr:hypothetical protein [Tanacetum cinerariifolium]
MTKGFKDIKAPNKDQNMMIVLTTTSLMMTMMTKMMIVLMGGNNDDDSGGKNGGGKEDDKKSNGGGKNKSGGFLIGLLDFSKPQKGGGGKNMGHSGGESGGVSACGARNIGQMGDGNPMMPQMAVERSTSPRPTISPVRKQPTVYLNVTLSFINELDRAVAVEKSSGGAGGGRAVERWWCRQNLEIDGNER